MNEKRAEIAEPFPDFLPDSCERVGKLLLAALDCVEALEDLKESGGGSRADAEYSGGMIG